MDSIQEKAEHDRDMKKILERSVADSAKRLCCKILRYEGNIRCNLWHLIRIFYLKRPVVICVEH